MLPRRRFLVTSFLAAPCLLRGAPTEGGTRDLVFRIGKGFGDFPPSNLEAVLRSAAEAVWRHCPDARWETKGFSIYARDDFPMMNFDHSDDGWLEVGLTTKGTYWAQFAYQFAHEFCHALAGHSNDWRKPWIRDTKANHWLEESLCETASLFTLRAMGRSWEQAPPYPNWKNFATKLADYAAERVAAAKAILPDEADFAAWFRSQEKLLRGSATLRDQNNVVASRLLPLFESDPSGWGTLPCHNLGPRRAEKSLAEHLRDWSDASPVGKRAFIARLGRVFGLPG